MRRDFRQSRASQIKRTVGRRGRTKVSPCLSSEITKIPRQKQAYKPLFGVKIAGLRGSFVTGQATGFVRCGRGLP
jgi:hypothetical protein